MAPPSAAFASGAGVWAPAPPSSSARLREAVTCRRAHRQPIHPCMTFAPNTSSNGKDAATYRIAVLTGDGDGPSMAAHAVNVLKAIGEYTDLKFDVKYADFGQPAVDKHGLPLPDETIQLCRHADAVIKSYQGFNREEPFETNPHLQLREALGLYAQLRPVRVYAELASLSPLRPENVVDLDMMFLREISGDVMESDKSRLFPYKSSDKVYSTMEYSREQVRRFARVALEVAEQRSGAIVNVDKADSLTVSKYWRKELHEYITDRLGDDRHDIILDDVLADDFARGAVLTPKRYDVVCTSNLFGDMISELLAGIAGPVRMSPTAWFSTSGVSVYSPADLYNAPAYSEARQLEWSKNPIALIRAVSMLLRYSLKEPAAADLVQKALVQTLQTSLTKEVASLMSEEDLDGRKVVSSQEFVDNLITSLDYMRQFEMVCDPVECGE